MGGSSGQPRTSLSTSMALPSVRILISERGGRCRGCPIGHRGADDGCQILQAPCELFPSLRCDPSGGEVVGRVVEHPLCLPQQHRELAIGDTCRRGLVGHFPAACRQRRHRPDSSAVRLDASTSNPQTAT